MFTFANHSHITCSINCISLYEIKFSRNHIISLQLLMIYFEFFVWLCRNGWTSLCDGTRISLPTSPQYASLVTSSGCQTSSSITSNVQPYIINSCKSLKYNILFTMMYEHNKNAFSRLQNEWMYTRIKHLICHRVYCYHDRERNTMTLTFLCYAIVSLIPLSAQPIYLCAVLWKRNCYNMMLLFQHLPIKATAY